MVTGHQHSTFASFQEKIKLPEVVEVAKSVGAKGFRLVGGKSQIIFTNTGERLFTVIHQIHFVDRHDQMFDPQQCGDCLLYTSETSRTGGILAAPVRDTMKRAEPGKNAIAHTVDRDVYKRQLVFPASAGINRAHWMR